MNPRTAVLHVSLQLALVSRDRILVTAWFLYQPPRSCDVMSLILRLHSHCPIRFQIRQTEAGQVHVQC